MRTATCSEQKAGKNLVVTKLALQKAQSERMQLPSAGQLLQMDVPSRSFRAS